MKRRNFRLIPALAIILVLILLCASCGIVDVNLNLNETTYSPPAESPQSPVDGILGEIFEDEDIPEMPSDEPSPSAEPAEEPSEEPSPEGISEDGAYSSKDDVALYIHTYGHLPQNFITKNEARELGWEGGSVEKYAPGCCIGGDHFGNYEGLLPDGDYTECDIDTLGASSRGAKRIIFSDDGRVYYTDDHYESFTQLY